MSVKVVKREVAVTAVEAAWRDAPWLVATYDTAACGGCRAYMPKVLGGWCVEQGARTLFSATCAEWAPTLAGATVAAMEFRAAEGAFDAARHACPSCGEREAVLVIDFAPDGTTRGRGVCRNCDWRDA